MVEPSIFSIRAKCAEPMVTLDERRDARRQLTISKEKVCSVLADGAIVVSDGGPSADGVSNGHDC